MIMMFTSLPVIFYALAVLAAMLVVGYLAVRLPVVRKSFIPGSLATGILLLLLGPQVAGVYFPQIDISAEYYDLWRTMPAHLINIVFACLFLGKSILPFREMWRMAGSHAAYGQMLAWGQYAIGGLLVLLLLGPLFGASPLFGAIIEISFEGGHGTAAGLLPVFNELGFQNGHEVAVALATVSLITALTAGMILVHWGRRRHYIKELGKQSAENRAYHRRIVHELRKQGITLRQHLTIPRIFNHLILIAVSVGFGWLIHQGLIGIESLTWGQSGVEIMEHMPLFPFCMFGGMIAQFIWTRLGLKVSKPLVELLSSIALSVLIATAVGSMSLAFMTDEFWIFFILYIAGAAWGVGAFLLLARRMFAKYWFQNGIVNMAQSMGMTATGLLFVHMVDPKNKTNAVESFGYKQLMFEPFVGGGIITALSMPIILNIGLPLFTAIATGLCLFWMLAGLLYFGRKKPKR